jgi:hypothetical protein
MNIIHLNIYFIPLNVHFILHLIYFFSLVTFIILNYHNFFVFLNEAFVLKFFTNFNL